MSLVHCRSCGNQISDDAPGCPKCGAPQKIKSKSNSVVWLLLVIVFAAGGAFFYFNTDIFSNNSKKIVIPEGAYILEKSPDKGVLRFLEAASSNLRGLGDHLTIYGDSVAQSTGVLSNVLASIDGGPTKFKIQKTGTDNQFLLFLNSGTVPLELTDAKELRITVGSVSLLYQHQ